MKSVLLTAAVAGLAAFGAAGAVQADGHAEACQFEGEVFDLNEADVARLYDCVDEQLAEAYAKEGDEIGSVYRDWQVTATGPAVPGAHSNRFLLTFANDVAYETYVQYPFEEGFTMPVGSILAKESYSLNKEGAPRLGPLFIMTKVAAGEADEFDNWVYSAVRTNGKPMGIKQSFCHDCHQAFVDQDSLGYPDFDVRFEVE